jgi:hypothetical protein
MKVNRTIKLENCWFFIVLGSYYYDTHTPDPPTA